MKKKHSLAWFLFGFGSQLQIIASLSFTELFVFLMAPFLFFKEHIYMKRNGIMNFFWLSMAVVLGCVIACVENDTYPSFVLRGMAVTCLLPCVIIVGHWMLRRDMGGFKWMLVGIAISSVLSTFIFQKSVEVHMLAGGEVGKNTATEIMSGPIYWISRLGAVLRAIPQGWYLQCPTIVAAAIPLFIAGFSMLTSTSGRSAALGAIGMVGLIIIGGKKRKAIKRRLCTKFGFLCCVGVVAIFVLHTAYRISAQSGWLGEEARNKYEVQTQGDKSIKRLLLGGRMEAFCGLIACVDKPIVGFGPWAVDERGYVGEFLSKYGTADDYDGFRRSEEYKMLMGGRKGLIPCHAYITEFWLWYGIFGLIFWLYVIFVLLRYLKQDCWAVPQWYVWLAASIPGYFWGIFFSPWSDRVGGIVFVVACLMARSVRNGVQQLPRYMEEELRKVESK